MYYNKRIDILVEKNLQDSIKKRPFFDTVPQS